jgi:hypothetical protein
VLASTAYAAGIINQTFFVSLVMLSVVTSLAADSWLERVGVRLGSTGKKGRQAGTDSEVPRKPAPPDRPRAAGRRSTQPEPPGSTMA